jgi:hypothetical protein
MERFNCGNNKSNGDSSVETPQQFYNSCVVDFHKRANELGIAEKGLIVIPELSLIGQETVLAFLKDVFFQMEFGQNPNMYYYVIMSLSIQAGMVFSKKWHENLDELKSGYVAQIIAEGPADVAYEIFSSEFGMEKNDFNEFTKKIFERWLVMHEPFWKLQDPREYTFSAMNAAYQLGVSMTLGKYGY